MLNFVVFGDDGTPASEWPLRHAHLLGPDQLPLQATIRFESGMIRCEKASAETAGLCVQVPVVMEAEDGVGGRTSMGTLTLPTCLLPEREEPYLLSLELARHQIMLFLNKLEDWGLFDLAAEHPVMAQFERARRAFTRALVAQRGEGMAFAPEADRSARQALALGIDAGERLTLINAERQLPERMSGRLYAETSRHYTAITGETPQAGAAIVLPGAGYAMLPGPPMVGCAAAPQVMTEPLQKTAAAACDFLCMPMRWIDMEPQESKYAFATTDRWIEWAVRTAKLPLVGGPLVDFRAECVPEWLYIWENDYETLRELVYEHVQSVVTRYRRTISRWTVASGLHVNTNFRLSFEQIIDLTRICVLLVRKLHPGSKVQLEVSQPWGEYHAENKRSLPPMLYLQAAMQQGISVDLVGLRVQMGRGASGQSTRDLMAFSAMLDRFGQLEKPIALTAVGCPSGPAPAKPGADESHEPGSWRSPWSEATQADWLAKVVGIAAAKPFIHSICWQELADATQAPEMPLGGLVMQNGQAKAAARTLALARAALREGKVPPGLAF